jgi:hypothetical protein
MVFHFPVITVMPDSAFTGSMLESPSSWDVLCETTTILLTDLCEIMRLRYHHNRYVTPPEQQSDAPNTAW